jgi:hypothetical protein
MARTSRMSESFAGTETDANLVPETAQPCNSATMLPITTRHVGGPP